MNALLEPRADIGVPKPTQVIRGPRLIVTLGADKTVTDPNDPTVLLARTMDVLVEYQKREINTVTSAHDPIPNKLISIEVPGLAWLYLDTTGQPATILPQATDPKGMLRIRLRREFLDKDVDTTRKDFVFTARIGILRNATTVNL
jgi:hypothetical protein